MARRQPMMLKYWPVTVAILAGFAAWDLYRSLSQDQPPDWVWLGLCGAAIVLVLRLRLVLRD